MSRREFIEELERLLADLPEEERRAAVQYYEDYFADAGPEHEADVIRELGGPEKTAASIRADYYGTEFREENYDNKAYMEKYGQNSRRREENAGWNEGADHAANDSGRQDAAGSGPGAWSESDSRQQSGPGTSRRMKILLVVLLALALIPWLWRVLLAILGCVFGLVCASIGIFAGLVIGSAAIMIAGIIMIGVAVVMVIPFLPVAFLVGGIGLILFALGMAATVGTVKLCAIVYPAMFKGIINLCRRPFYGKAV